MGKSSRQSCYEIVSSNEEWRVGVTEEKKRCETCECYDCDCDECNCDCHKENEQEVQGVPV